MSKHWQNGFFIFGLIVLALMVTQLDFAATWAGLQRAGYWAVAVIVLWAFLYLFNTAAWWLIVKSQEEQRNSTLAKDNGRYIQHREQQTHTILVAI